MTLNGKEYKFKEAHTYSDLKTAQDFITEIKALIEVDNLKGFVEKLSTQDCATFLNAILHGQVGNSVSFTGLDWADTREVMFIVNAWLDIVPEKNSEIEEVYNSIKEKLLKK